MADKKITALTENTALASTDLFHVVDSPSSNPSNQKVTVNNVFMSIPAPLAFSAIAAISTATAIVLTDAITSLAAATGINITLLAGAVGQVKFVTSGTAQITNVIPAATGGAYARIVTTNIGENYTLLYHTTTVTGWYTISMADGKAAAADGGATIIRA